MGRSSGHPSIGSGDDEHPELAPVPAGDARVAVEVRHLELAAPGVGRRPQVVGDPRHLQRRQLRQAPLRLHRRLLEIDLDPRRPCSIVVFSEFREDRAEQRMASWQGGAGQTLTDDLELVRQRGRGLDGRQRPRRAELELDDVVQVPADHVDALEHLAERDGEEAAGGRAGAAAAERPRREGAAVHEAPPALQPVEVPA